MSSLRWLAGLWLRRSKLASAISGAYDGLKKAVIEELGGKTGAVQALEENPGLGTARAMLAEELASRNIAETTQLQTLAERLESAISEAKTAGVPRAGDINFEEVRGQVNATVSDLVAAGSITFGSVIANAGDANVRNLRAGLAPQTPSEEFLPKKG